jgi:hypothetical protein
MGLQGTNEKGVELKLDALMILEEICDYKQLGSTYPPPVR